MKKTADRIFSPIQKHKTAAVIYIIVFMAGCRIGELYRLSKGSLTVMSANLDYLYKTLPRLKPADLQWGAAFAMLLAAWMYYEKITRKNMKPGIEYGSARWGNSEDIKPYIDDNFYNNVILSQTEFLTMKPKMKVFEHNRNKNVLVYGDSVIIGLS